MCSRLSGLLSRANKIIYRSSSAYTCKVLEPVVLSQRRVYATKNYPNNTRDYEKEENEKAEHNLAGAIGQQYEEYRDEDSTIIFDVDEEKKKMIDLDTINALHEYRDPYEGLNMKRGINGVYEIKDLVDLLRRDKAKDIFVVSVAPELSYVDYIVIVTGNSIRHMGALATFVRKVYKEKANPTDILPKIEGAKSEDWMALDLGNIALHIFSKNARYTYDLESLWALGKQFDRQSNKQTAEQEFEARYNKYLSGLQPADE